MTVEICSEAREDFVKCVLRTNCVLRENRSVRDCINHPQDLPEECVGLLHAFSNCKKGMVSRARESWVLTDLGLDPSRADG